jgi:hypothetical protein
MRVKAVGLALALTMSLVSHAEPTIFFQKHGASIDERVDVFVRCGERPRSGRVELAITGHTFSEPLHTDQEFGEERISFRDSRVRTPYAGPSYCGCEWAHGTCAGDAPAAEEMDALSCASRAS